MLATGVGELSMRASRITSHRYVAILDEVLESSILKLMRWFEENKVPMLDWRVQSHDISPIENL